MTFAHSDREVGMRVSVRIAKVSAIVFVVMFSTVAVAQRLIARDHTLPLSPVISRNGTVREIPVFFPQGRLYCVNGTLAYQTLYPAGWARLSSDDAVKIASQSVDDACLGGDQNLCKEYRARLSKLRLAIRGCF
jgi:hypothetical protein